MYIGERETSKFWLSVMNELKNRGVEDIRICSVDGLNGFSQTIIVVYPHNAASYIKVEGKWRDNYPSSMKSWRENWAELSTYFVYPQVIRKRIYTTNSIENFNRQLRKGTKTKSSYPSDDALLKSLYLAILDITKKWTGTAHNWMSIVNQFMIYFEGRIVNDDLIV